MRILFKYPTRGRTKLFFAGLDSIYRNISDPDNFHVAITIDTDDSSMNNDTIIGEIMAYGNISIQLGHSESKINAINRDIPDYAFEVLMCMSDDMRFNFYGFDQIVRMEMPATLDHLLHFWDVDTKGTLATMYIAGKKWLESRGGEIYNSAYKSLFCDNEEEECAKILGKHKMVDYSIYTHLNPAYGHLSKDQMFIDQQEIGWTVDHATYLERRANNFYL